MNKSLALKKKFYLFFSLVFSFLVFLYLINLIFNAERGPISYYKLKNQFNQYELKLKNLKIKNKILSRKIERLQPNTIDLDYLDEKFKINTGIVGNREIVIYFDE
tara:strand:+ start:680 stop:994 length:315 start_codon:yes stop_codon:yes gene_type:complete